MPGSRYDALNTGHISEGNSERTLTNRAVYNRPETVFPTFLKMIILEIISDPATLDDVKLTHYKNDLGVSNLAAAQVAPRNSIIARRVIAPDSSASEPVMVLYPFFPPHMSLPAKPGEHVWAIFEHPGAKVNDIGYWMCRIVQPNFVEDVNYTHADRQFDQSFAPGIAATMQGSATPVYEFRNGAVDVDNGERFTKASTVSLLGTDTAYNDILTTTDASLIINYEPVPRYRKRPADTAFEGSNNTLIVLGTDRTGPIASYTTDPALGQVPAFVDDDVYGTGAGALDLVVGRGQTGATAGSSQDNKVIGLELAKDTKSLVPAEGDPDPINDRSRILIAQSTNADVNFGLQSFLTDGILVGQISDPALKSTGAVVAKSDRIRLISRSDIALVSTGQGSLDANGLLTDDTDMTKWSLISIKSTGDVYIQPVTTGSVDIETTKCNITVNPNDLDISTTACDLAMNQTDTILTIGPTVIDANASSVTITSPAVALTTPQLTATGGAGGPLAMGMPTMNALTQLLTAVTAIATAANAGMSACTPLETGAIAFLTALSTGLQPVIAAITPLILPTQILSGKPSGPVTPAPPKPPPLPSPPPPPPPAPMSGSTGS